LFSNGALGAEIARPLRLLATLNTLRTYEKPMITTTAECLTIVSGLPRSGTSMMMQMLEAGGMPVITDYIRTPDTDNPKGYYEFEAVKRTKEDDSWLQGSEGKAVKMVYKLLYDLPNDRSYRVVFMVRKLEEVLASQRVMLQRNGAGADQVSDEQLHHLFRSELQSFDDWVSRQPNTELIKVDYNRIHQNAQPELERVNEFLGENLDVEAMTAVVDKSLYRNRI
jgi:hypothetical protein